MNSVINFGNLVNLPLLTIWILRSSQNKRGEHSIQVGALAVIRDKIHEQIPDCRVILFGSRAGKQFNAASDYDVLVITEDEFAVNEERRFASLIRKNLALLAIDADVIVKSKIEIEYFRDKYGSVVREALKEGMPI